MTERIADSNNCVSEKHLNLYRRWSEGGCGLLISGNVMVDRYNIEGAGNVILEEKNFRDQKNMLKRWKSTTASGNFSLVIMKLHTTNSYF